MARNFRPVDRDSLMLLPPDLRDWLPSDHLAWLVIDVVESLDLSAIRGRYRLGSTGREAFDPAMMTQLLIYGYCIGVRSSRQLEARCLTDAAFAVITAQARPDHCTISRFRASHDEALTALMSQVLQVCVQAGMGKVGTVSIDGTKISANASMRRNADQARLQHLAQRLIADAAAVDAAEDAEYGPDRSGAELPPELAAGPDRVKRLRAAAAAINAEKDAATAGDVRTAEAVVARAQAARDRVTTIAQHRHQTRPPRAGRIPIDEHQTITQAHQRLQTAQADLETARAGRGPAATAAADTRRNTTDPDSRVMPGKNGGGWIQGFNAQIAVTDDHLIVATDVVTDTTDTAQFVPMMHAATTAITEALPGTQIGVILADAGYCSAANLTADGPDRLIAVGRHPAGEHRGKTLTNPHLIAMQQRLTTGTPDRATYARRSATVETVIGHLKDLTGLRRFSRRGLTAVRHELNLAAIAHNIRRLATHQAAPA